MNIVEFLSGQHAIVLFFILIAYLAIGDFVSLKTKAFFPSVFIFSLLVLLTAWAGLIPPGIFTLSGVSSPFAGVVALLIVVNMGTTLEMSDIVKNWRVVIIGLMAIVGTAIFVLAIGTPIFGWEAAVVSAPVVAGGMVASLEMQAAAKSIGNDSLAVVAALILAFQAFPGFVLTPLLLKREMKRDLAAGGRGTTQQTAIQVGASDCKIPEKYLSTATLLAMTAFIGVLSYMCAQFTKTFMGSFSISQSIFGLLFGILFSVSGLVPKGVLKWADSSGLVLILTIFSAFSVLATTTFQEVMEIAGPVLGTIGLGIVGIFVVCAITAKLFKMSWELAVALGLNCLLGFPLNYQLTIEAIKAVTTDPEDAKYLEDKYMPMMLVAGFVTITIGSVVLAGILRNFI